MKGFEALSVEGPTGLVHAAMLHEARQAEAVLDRYQRRTKVPRRARRLIDAHLERARILRHELWTREGLERVKEENARYRAALADRLAEPVVQPQRWDNLREAMELIEGMLEADPGARAQAEIVTAYVVDVMRGIGLDPTRPDTLYAVLSGAGLLTELASNGHQRGEVEHSTVVAIARVAQTLTAALIPYLPEAEKPDLSIEIPDDPSALFEGWGSADEDDLPGDLTAEKIRAGQADDEVVSHVGEIYFDSHETINRECELCQRAAAIGAFDRFDMTDGEGWPVVDPDDQ